MLYAILLYSTHKFKSCGKTFIVTVTSIISSFHFYICIHMRMYVFIYVYIYVAEATAIELHSGSFLTSG